LPLNGINVAAETKSLTLNQVHTVTVTREQPSILTFTPTQTGYYTLTSFSNDDPYCMLYKGNEELAFGDDTAEHRNFCLKAKLEAGVTYKYAVDIYNCDVTTIDVKLEKSPYVTDIKVTAPPVYTTYFKGYTEDYFSADGMELMLTLSDGSTEAWTFSENYLWGGLFDLSIDASKMETTGEVSLFMDEAKSKLDVTVLDKTVKTLEVIDENFTPLVFESDGFWTYDDDFNDYFYYFSNYENLGLKITYSDNSVEIFDSITEEMGAYYANYYDNQETQHWTINGKKNTVTIEFLNAKVNYNVKVVENPVKSITLNQAPTRQYISGDPNYGYTYDGEYFFYPEDLTGLKFTVNFKNGTKKTYTYNDIDKDGFSIDGYWLELDYDYFAEPGKVPVTLRYRGCEVSYNVTLKASGVSKVEFIKAPTVKSFDFSNFTPDYLGAQFKITYTNGKTKTVTISKSNSEYIHDYELGENIVRIAVDQSYAEIVTYCYDDECETVLTYLDASSTEYDFVTYENNTFRKVEALSFKPNGQITVKVTNSDNSTETLNLIPESVSRTDYGDSVETAMVASTEKGITNSYFVMYEDNLGVFELDVLNKYFVIEVESVKGDFDYSGKIDLSDVVILAQYSAGWNITCDDSAMNINGDSETNLQDVVYLAQYVAGWQGVEIK